MRFTINSKTLLRSLQSIVGVTSSNSVLSILEDVRMELKGSDLSLAATDLDVRVSVTCTVSDSDGEGVICVPAKLFVDALKNLSEQALQITVDGMAVRIKSLTGTYAIAGEDAKDFPHPPSQKDVVSFTVPPALLLEMIGNTVYATMNDTLQPAACGVFFDTTTKPAICVSTDKHRLIRFDMPGVTTDAAEFVLGKKALNFLRSALPASGDDLTISIGERNFFTSFGSLSFSCMLVDAKYLPWRAVWPEESAFTLAVSRPDLLTALRQVAVFANQTTHQVVLSITEKSLVLSSQDIDFSNEGAETLPCSFDGKEMKIAFNGKLLSEMIDHLTGSEITIALSTPTRAAILSSPDDAGHTQLLMPLMVGA